MTTAATSVPTVQAVTPTSRAVLPPQPTRASGTRIRSVTEVDDVNAQRFWSLYLETFGELAVRAVNRHLLRREEFMAVMVDPRIEKILIEDEDTGELIAMCTLTNQLETVDWVSPELFFDRTRYYAGEMGWPLYRRFISFEDLTSPERLVQLKHKTNGLEQQTVTNEKRKINIDPGYISPERLILATGKNFTHRVYLSQGIYADLTLIFQKGCFTPLPWTYPDYADPAIIQLFNQVRENYMKALKQTAGPEVTT